MAAQLAHKTHKVLEIEIDSGFSLVCVVNYEENVNPFYLYAKWFDGKQRKQLLTRMGCLHAVVDYVCDWMHDRHIGYDYKI